MFKGLRQRMPAVFVAGAIVAGGIAAGGIVGVGGCQHDAINREAKNTFLTADDMKAMTDQMAQSIIADPRVQQEIARAAGGGAGGMRIVVRPVINETSEIITDNRKEMFVHRLQGLLSQNDAMRGRFTWCVNRADYEKLRAEEIPESQLGPTEERIQPEYALSAKFLSDTNTTTKARSDLYLCQYQLTRISGPATGEILWTGQYLTSKQVKKGFLD